MENCAAMETANLSKENRTGAGRQLLDAASLRRWTLLIPGRNLFHVLFEYALLLLMQGLTFWFFCQAEQWGVSWWGRGAVGLAVFVLTGCFMHRIALLGHEASHYLLLRNRKWNDIIADLLCFFPLWSTLVSYRQKHLGHHLYPNAPGKDPNLGSEDAERLFASFPMKSPSGIYRYYALFFWPPFVLRYLLDLIKVLAVGNSRIAQGEEGGGEGRKGIRPLYLGLLYLVIFRIFLGFAERTGSDVVAGVGPVMFHLLLGVGGTLMIPRSWFKKWKVKLNYGVKVAAVIRITFYALLLAGISWGRHFGGFNFGPFYLVFWLLPLVYVFPYLMLLRELYHHANLGTGKLDNSRIIHAGPLTRWALLGYGNDYHLVHHVYPNIPHYHLRAAHRGLMEQSGEYRRQFEEVHGTVRAPAGRRSLAEALALLRRA